MVTNVDFIVTTTDGALPQAKYRSLYPKPYKPGVATRTIQLLAAVRDRVARNLSDREGAGEEFGMWYANELCIATRKSQHSSNQCKYCPLNKAGICDINETRPSSLNKAEVYLDAGNMEQALEILDKVQNIFLGRLYEMLGEDSIALA